MDDGKADPGGGGSCVVLLPLPGFGVTWRTGRWSRCMGDSYVLAGDKWRRVGTRPGTDMSGTSELCGPGEGGKV